MAVNLNSLDHLRYSKLMCVVLLSGTFCLSSLISTPCPSLAPESIVFSAGSVTGTYFIK